MSGVIAGGIADTVSHKKASLINDGFRVSRGALSAQYSGANADIIRSSKSTAPDGADSGSVADELGHP